MLDGESRETTPSSGNATSAQGAVPRPYTATVQLPAGVTCTQCTLQLRQIMLAAETDPCPPATIAAGATYYTCADVTLTASPAPPDMAMAPVDMAQTVSPDFVVSVNPEPGAMSTGCQTSGVPAAGGSALALLLGSTGILLHRRRTSRR